VQCLREADASEGRRVEGGRRGERTQSQYRVERVRDGGSRRREGPSERGRRTALTSADCSGTFHLAAGRTLDAARALDGGADAEVEAAAARGVGADAGAAAAAAEGVGAGACFEAVGGAGGRATAAADEEGAVAAGGREGGGPSAACFGAAAGAVAVASAGAGTGGARGCGAALVLLDAAGPAGGGAGAGAGADVAHLLARVELLVGLAAAAPPTLAGPAAAAVVVEPAALLGLTADALKPAPPPTPAPTLRAAAPALLAARAVPHLTGLRSPTCDDDAAEAVSPYPRGCGSGAANLRAAQNSDLPWAQLPIGCGRASGASQCMVTERSQSRRGESRRRTRTMLSAGTSGL